MNAESQGTENKSNKGSGIAEKNIELNRHDDKNDYEIMPDDFNQYDYTFKVIIIGETGVGKSCITSKGVKDFYPFNQKCTIAFEYLNFIIRLDKHYVKLNIWDTSGQEAYKSMVTNFYRNSSLAILVYALDDKNTFDVLGNWLKELRINSNPDVKVFIVGNKNDLTDRQVNKDEAYKFKEENKIDFVIEASAKTGENIEKIFVEASRVLLNDYLYYMKISNENYCNKSESKRTRSLSYRSYSWGISRNYNDREQKKGSFLLNKKDFKDRRKNISSSCNC